MKGCIIKGSLQTFSGEAMDKMVPSEMKDVGTRRVLQDSTKTNLVGFCSKWVFQADDVLKYLAL